MANTLTFIIFELIDEAQEKKKQAWMVPKVPNETYDVLYFYHLFIDIQALLNAKTLKPRWIEN